METQKLFILFQVTTITEIVVSSYQPFLSFKKKINHFTSLKPFEKQSLNNKIIEKIM
jgi:hypothetical protein